MHCFSRDQHIGLANKLSRISIKLKNEIQIKELFKCFVMSTVIFLKIESDFFQFLQYCHNCHENINNQLYIRC